MRFLYTFAIRAYSLGVRVASWWGNAKARQWVEGRKRLPEAKPDGERWIWFHAASLGEFEQGRPVMEKIKEKFPQYKIVLSFFSPSGYEIRKDYDLADEVCYLPSDTLRNAHRWLKRHDIVAAFFIKYEFWFNYMKALHDKHIPLFYVSVLLKPDQYFFKWYGGWFRKQLHYVTHFYAQDKATAKLLEGLGLKNTTVCGDTRFDRVAAIAKQTKRFPEVEAFLKGRKCIIAGSSWQPDEKLLAAYLPQLPDNYCLILAPHDIGAAHLAQIKAWFPDSVLYSENDFKKDSKVLVINTIGILSQLYQYARFVYIGGGFGVNIHNIQEPVTFGCPVVFGPKYKNFKEAVDLVINEGAFTISCQNDLNGIFDRLISDERFYFKASSVCIDYLNSQVGATKVILQDMARVLSQNTTHIDYGKGVRIE